VTYGGPTEFKYNKKMIPHDVELHWSDTMMYHWMTRIPGLYDDIYMDLTFVEVMDGKVLTPLPLRTQRLTLRQILCYGMPISRADTTS
jgi:hypothetical protein